MTIGNETHGMTDKLEQKLDSVEYTVNRLRAMGVVCYRDNGVEFQILPFAPTTESKLEPVTAHTEQKQGKDGLTQDQQLELYGRIMDAEG